MKLYATTTSERASKGQGGNEYIETVYNVGIIPTYSVTVYPDGSIVVKDIIQDETLFRKDIIGTWGEVFNKTKGEKKKGGLESIAFQS